MKSTATTSSRTWGDPAGALTIRWAVSTDAAALSRLAGLDSAPLPARAPMLLAEVGGNVRAALPLEGGPAIADPFQPTAELVAILEKRARQLAPSLSLRRAARRRRVLPGWRAVRSARA